MSPPPIWVFGYASLVWRPALPFVDRRAARVTGWARRFWQASSDHRGTPEAPGRVATLVPAPGAIVWGVAYAIADVDWPAVRELLEVREQGGYDRVDAIAGLAAGLAAGEVIAEVPAVMYVGGDAGGHFVGPEPLETTAAIVRRSRGPSGDNATYVRELARALVEMGAPDPEVEALAALLPPPGA
jgi:glutathione-specific gamma-glutamylcyclotransferase